MIRGIGWLRAIRGARVPLLTRHRVVAAAGEDVLSEVTVAPVDEYGARVPGPERRLQTDREAIGLEPRNRFEH